MENFKSNINKILLDGSYSSESKLTTDGMNFIIKIFKKISSNITTGGTELVENIKELLGEYLKQDYLYWKSLKNSFVFNSEITKNIFPFLTVENNILVTNILEYVTSLILLKNIIFKSFLHKNKYSKHVITKHVIVKAIHSNSELFLLYKKLFKSSKNEKNKHVKIISKILSIVKDIDEVDIDENFVDDELGVKDPDSAFFDVFNGRDLYDIYSNNEKELTSYFIKMHTIKSSFSYKREYFGFLNKYSKNIKKVIEHIIRFDSNKILDDDVNTKMKVTLDNITNLEDYYEILNFFHHPPFYFNKIEPSLNEVLNDSKVINHDNLKELSKKMLENENMDFTLTIVFNENIQKIKIHSFFLNKFEYFNNLISFNNTDMCKIEVYHEKTPEDLIQFIITGVIDIYKDKSRYESLLEVADMLLMDDLIKICKIALENI